MTENVMCAAGHVNVAENNINQDFLNEACNKPRQQGHSSQNMFLLAPVIIHFN
jgi:hypothetical protein